jgi:hypothetical protein
MDRFSQHKMDCPLSAKMFSLISSHGDRIRHFDFITATEGPVQLSTQTPDIHPASDSWSSAVVRSLLFMEETEILI